MNPAIAGGLISGGSSLIGTIINNAWADKRTANDRYYNYLYNEMAAGNADLRTRKLYKDFYSPLALLQQYQDAGLSPSLMFGGTPGQGGMQGAKGAGVSGPQTPYMPISVIEAAQAAALFAQAKKANAETENIEVDTIRDRIQKGIEEMKEYNFRNEFELMTIPMYKEDGKPTSLYEAAQQHYDYEGFLEEVRQTAVKSDRQDLVQYLSTEAGQKTLRSIYTAANRFSRDIAVLSEEKTAAEFQEDVLNAMKKEGFAEMNATAALSYLRANVQTAELTKTQKEAWNNLINRLGSKGSTTRDIIVVLGMILNQAASNWHLPAFQQFNTNNTTNNIL